MRKVFEYSHFGGSEVLTVRHPGLVRDINAAIAAPVVTSELLHAPDTAPGRKGLLDPKLLRDGLRGRLREAGFAEAEYKAKIPLADGTGEFTEVTRRAYLVRDGVMVNVLFGTFCMPLNAMARMHLFAARGLCHAGVAIMPCHRFNTLISGRGPSGEELVYELRQLRGALPQIPVAVMLVDAEGAAPRAARANGMADRSGGPTDAGHTGRGFASREDLAKLPEAFRRRALLSGGRRGDGAG